MSDEKMWEEDCDYDYDYLSVRELKDMLERVNGDGIVIVCSSDGSYQRINTVVCDGQGDIILKVGEKYI